MRGGAKERWMPDARHASDLDLMREVEAYNEVDCRAMVEIVEYLRRNH